MGMNREWRWGSLAYEGDTTNDVDLITGTDTGAEYLVKGVRVEIVASDSAGNRVPVVQIQDAATDVISEFRAGIATAASATRYYQFAPGVSVSTEIVDTDYIPVNIPDNLILPAGHQLRVFEEANVDASSDSFIIQALVGIRRV